MQSASYAQFSSLANTYYQLGWAGFAFVMLFNFGFLVLYGIDLYFSCMFSNKELMDNIRREFYGSKYNTYEAINTDPDNLKRLNNMIHKGVIEPLKF
jgi:hypothetical protein